MKNTFFNKVVFERKVLRVVNSSMVANTQLSGLSKATIERWIRTVGLDDASDLINQLLKLGELCQTLSDRSHESFVPLRPDIEFAIDSNLAKLELLIRSIKDY